MKKFIFIISIFIFTTLLPAQEALKSVEENYYDFLSLQGLVERPTLGYRTLSDSVWELEEGTEHIWQNNNLGATRILWESENQGENWFSKGFYHGLKYKVFGPEWYNSYNTAVPYGQNDGALWQGRGYNTSLTAGLRAEGYGFEVTIKPQVTFSENKPFDTLYGNFITSWPETGSIDVVQRYGTQSLFDFSFGDSEIRYNLYNFTIGFGFQSPWLGSAQLNPMLGSNNATPYMKLDIGLRKTEVILPFCDWNLGFIEGRVWAGVLEQSEYFNGFQVYSNGNRMLCALSASYSPSFIEGFTVGLNRIFITYWDLYNIYYIYRLFNASRSNGIYDPNVFDEDQKFSIFVDWFIPKIGLNIYGEFGRDDFATNEKTIPFHTGIYTVGVKQIIPLPKQLKSEICFEWNNFEMSQDFQLQWPYMGYYAHGSINQGYTNKGQILGAGTGSFGNSQFIQYKIYYPIGYTALKFHRYCPDNNSVYSKAVNQSANYGNSELNTNWYSNFETYLVFGLEQNLFLFSNLNITGEINYIKIESYKYIRYNTGNTFNISLNIKYNF